MLHKIVWQQMHDSNLNQISPNPWLLRSPHKSRRQSRSAQRSIGRKKSPWISPTGENSGVSGGLSPPKGRNPGPFWSRQPRWVRPMSAFSWLYFVNPKGFVGMIYIYIIHLANNLSIVGKYTIHGSYGIIRGTCLTDFDGFWMVLIVHSTCGAKR